MAGESAETEAVVAVSAVAREVECCDIVFERDLGVGAGRGIDPACTVAEMELAVGYCVAGPCIPLFSVEGVTGKVIREELFAGFSGFGVAGCERSQSESRAEKRAKDY